MCELHFCGDGVRTEAEQCDGQDLGGQTCEGIGFYGQTKALACNPDCTFDKTGCVGICGDGVRNGNEECDGTDLGGTDCRGLGFYSAPGLRCSTACSLDTSSCQGWCGDGITNGSEICDGAPPPGTCVSYGFDQGFLGCSALCKVDVSGCATFGRAPTQNGVFWNRAASAPSALTKPSSWGASADDVYVTNDINPLMHWDGTSWTEIAETVSDTYPYTMYTLDAVWGSSSNDVFAGGASFSQSYGDEILHWDGTSWSRMQATPISVSGLWGSGPNDVYASGWFWLGDNQGGLLHWDGTIWSQITTPIGGLTDAAVWNDGSEVFIIDTYPTYLRRWDGTTWTTIADGYQATSATPYGQNLFSVWGSGRNDVYAVGVDGTILHVGSTTIVTMQSGTAQPLRVVRGSSASDVFAAGDGALLHLRNGVWETLAVPKEVSTIQAMWVTPKRVFLFGPTGEIELERTTVTCIGPEQMCDDGWDNDCDGLADAADPDCRGHVTEQCANLVDDNGDGLVDCADPVCAAFPSCKKH